MDSKLFTSNLITAAAYFIGGHAGLLLAIPPSNAAAVWPAAGIALAAILVCGNRILPGIFLGSILIQTTSFLDASSTEKIISSIFIGTVMSVGVACQAWAGAKLVHHIFRDDEALLRERSILLFCLLAGPASCVISASIGIFTLWFQGILTVSDLALAWSTWWIGDSIGVLVFAPIVLCFFGKPRDIWRQRITNVALPLCILSSIAFIVFKISYQKEIQYLEDDFETNTIHFTNALKKSIDIHLNSALVLKEYFDSSIEILPDAFSQFVLPKINRYPEIQALEWIPKVLHEDREQFEYQLGSSIKKPDSHGEMIISPEKEFYYPIQYVEPYPSNENVLGYDISNNPLALDAAEAACSSGKVSVTDAIRLVQDIEEQVGLVFYAPVYKKNSHGDYNATCEDLMGFTASVFRLENEIKNLHEKLPEIKLAVSLKNNSQLFYSNSPEINGSHNIPQQFSFRFERKYLIPVANQQWEIIYNPTEGFISLYSSWAIWLIIVGGLLISAISGMGLLMLTGRTLRTEEIIKLRTAELNSEITERKLAEDTLRESNERFRAAYEEATIGMSMVGLEHRIIQANPAFCNMLGYTMDELIGVSFKEITHPDDVEKSIDQHQKLIRGKVINYHFEKRYIHKQGHELWVSLSVSLVRNKDAEPLYAIAQMQDITDRKHVEEALKNVAEGFAVIRGKEFFNKVCLYLTEKLDVDYAFIGELVDNDKIRVIGGANSSDLIESFEYDLENTPCQNVIGQSTCCYPSGVQTSFPKDSLLTEMNIDGYLGAPIFDNSGHPLGIIVLMKQQAITNVKIAESILKIFSDRVSAEIQRMHIDDLLSYQAAHDDLTGLVNRREFERRAERILDTIRQDKDEHALCFLDLDQFKVVNDTCGHAAGDEMLRQITAVLQAVIRKRDTLARLGGDEFGVLMEHCTLDDAHRVATSLQRAIQDFQFSWEGQSFKAGVSIGLVPITETISNLTQLLKDADAACYMAKELGRDRIHIYHHEDEELTKRSGEMQWVTRLNHALEKDRFCLYAQAIVPLGASADRHYELLIRMINEKGEMIPPGAFLPAAERYNLVSKIDYWVIENAFTLLADNPVFIEDIDFCSINLSGQSLTNPDVLEFIVGHLNESGIDGHKICFEITETAAISNLSIATKFISILKGLGCRFALDDFGSGLSSFAYLKNLPVDYLKIDGIFVKDIVDDPIDHAMVKSINEIGQVMGMQTIAEFVENDEIKGMLREIGVNYAQGFGIGKPQLFLDIING